MQHDYPEGMVFPASKDDILAEGRRQHLPPEVMERLERLPDKKYSSVSEMVTTALRGEDKHVG
ncbi:MAG: DUF2795 domain-containing protein [Armatimonadota bacterium]